MLIPTLLVAAALLAPPVHADTVVQVDRGIRLDMEAWRGQVTVQVWDRDAVRVRTASPGERSPEFSRVGSVLRVRPAGGVDHAANMEFDVTVPRWMGVSIHGQQVDVSITGTEGEVAIETVSGPVVIEGGRGRVSVRTLSGRIAISNTRGRVDAWTLNESVTLENIVGDISVETTNGGITMRGVRSGSVRAATVNGSVTYHGHVLDQGRYAFTTHNGNIDVTIPGTANATVSAATYHGAFRADFPVRLTGMSRERHYDFTLGSGSARIELESFNGDITLRQPRQGQ